MLRFTLIALSACLLTITAQAQTLPIYFESDITTADFVDFDGGTGEVVANPYQNPANSSENVGRIVRIGGEIWAGSKILLEETLDFSVNTTIQMKVYTDAPVGTTVRLKLEGGAAFDNDAETTVSGEWETLVWDYTGQPAVYTDLVFMFDFGNYGDGSETSTFYFDDIKQSYIGEQLDLPVTFEDPLINYGLTDFAGNTSFLETDPEDAENTVARIVRMETAWTYAGTTIGTPGGFVSNIPFSNDSTIMTVRVWSPQAGYNVRLKVENATDGGQTCETESITTAAGAWETMTFDFSNAVPGTPSLASGLGQGWTYNKASIFFNFGLEGWQIGEQTYYIDDVYFGMPPEDEEEPISIDKLAASPLLVHPTHAGNWSVSLQGAMLHRCSVFDVFGKLLFTAEQGAQYFEVPAAHWPSGQYIVVVSSSAGNRSVSYVHSTR